MISISTIAFGQVEQFYKAVENQDMTSIASLLMDEVEVCVKDDQKIMTKAKALDKIKNFLASINPKSVTALHSGSSGAGSKYKVAKLNSADGVYRIFVYMEKSAGKELIQEVRFDTF